MNKVMELNITTYCYIPTNCPCDGLLNIPYRN